MRFATELETHSFTTLNFNDFTGAQALDCFVKIRYRSPKIPCLARPAAPGLEVALKAPAYGIAKGQLAVFYDEFDRVLGSGFVG